MTCTVHLFQNRNSTTIHDSFDVRKHKLSDNSQLVRVFENINSTKIQDLYCTFVREQKLDKEGMF